MKPKRADSPKGLVYDKSPHMTEPKRPKHDDQGIGDELSAVHLSTFLVLDSYAPCLRDL